MAQGRRRLQERAGREAHLLTARGGDPALPLVDSTAGVPVVVSTRALTKRFPGVLAVDGVDLDIRAGEIVALLGANGAGKSTLIQMLAGVHPYGSYDGEILLDGAPLRSARVRDAERAGVVLIPQEVQVVPELSVARNVLLNDEPTRFGIVDWAAGDVAAARALLAFGVPVPIDARMGSLDLATQQLVMIARVLSKRARVLILDEPTAALTEVETERLFRHLRALRATGVASIFVSHRLSEVFQIADRIVVMRDGRIRGDRRIAETTRGATVRLMVGEVPGTAKRAGRPRGAPLLEVAGLTARDPTDRARVRVEDVSLTVHAGEVVGLFGLLGAGCGTVAKAIFGAWRGQVSGAIRLGGDEVTVRDPADAVAAGLGLLSQDRRDSLVLEHSIADNVSLASLRALSRVAMLDVERKRRLARDQQRALAIRARSADDRVGTLSGGNQQKVQVARWLVAGSRVLLLDDPTRGVDVGARAEIHALLRELAAEGRALLFVSSEVQELLETCDRILVMRHGRLVAESPADAATEAGLLAAAAGVAAADDDGGDR